MRETERVECTRLLLVSLSLLLAHTATPGDGCVHGDLTLSGQQQTQTRVAGFVRYCWNNEWRAVCANHLTNIWTYGEATVVCGELGYSDTGAHNDRAPSDTVRSFVTLECANGGSSLQECVVKSSTCPPMHQVSRYAKATCQKETCTNNDWRLEGGATMEEGRVEVCLNGRWGTVQTSQPINIAAAICNSFSLSLRNHSTCLDTQFGYRLSKPVYSCSVRSEGTLTCSGGDTDDHSMDLGVVCGTPPLEECTTCCRPADGQFRLTNGSTHREGRVEVCMNGRWGTVCNNSQEGIAGAVCFLLGLSAQGAEVIPVPQTTTSDWTRQSYHCYSNTTCTESCCDLSMSLAVRCPPPQEPVTTESVITGNQNNSSQTGTVSPDQLSNIITPVAAVLAILVAVVVAIVIIILVVVIRRRRSTNLKQRNQSYSLQQVDNNIYDSATEPSYSSMGPAHDTRVHTNYEELDTYEVIREQQNTNTPANPTPVRDEHGKKEDEFYDAEQHTYAAVNVKQKKRAKKREVGGDPQLADAYDVIGSNEQKTNPPQLTPIRDEASKEGDNFYDAEQHTYSAVNVSRKKKTKKNTSEDGEGEMSQPPLYETAMLGGASWGAGEEGYSKLKH